MVSKSVPSTEIDFFKNDAESDWATSGWSHQSKESWLGLSQAAWGWAGHATLPHVFETLVINRHTVFRHRSFESLIVARLLFGILSG